MPRTLLWINAGNNTHEPHTVKAPANNLMSADFTHDIANFAHLF